MASRAILVLGLVLATGLEAGCGPTPEPHSGVDPGDAAIDVDGAIETDSGSGNDSGTTGAPDASAPSSEDAAVDAAIDCGSCAASGACSRAACVAGRCVETFVEDGSLCDEAGLHVCVAGRCAARECGDGWVEPGPMPTAERCDDGNHVDGDGCDAACRITPVVVDADPADHYVSTPTAGARSIGVDGQGRVLFVWIRDEIDHEEIHAAIVGPYGAPITTDTIVLEPMLLTPSHAEPTVVGLRDGGWVVAWSAIRGRSRDVVFVRIGTEGQVDPEVIANRQRSGDQLTPSLAAVGESFAVAWTSDFETATDPYGGAYVRVFAADGVGLTSELPVASDRSGIEGAVELDGTADGFVATFTQSRYEDSLRPSVRARRFSATGPRDAGDLVLTGLDEDQPAVACRSDGFCAIAHRDRTLDPAGDVRLRWIPPSGPIDSVLVAVAETPSHAESRPVVAVTPSGGLLVAWEDAAPGRVAYRLLPAEVLGPEDATLSALLDSRAYGDLSLTTTRRGTWFAMTAQVPGRFLESFSAFFLPLAPSP